ncbi:hypothetical protein COI83_29785 [Bacillus cereus]|nr:hypothetical protein COI83_29785 [Bacillus cereus]
MWKNAYRVLRKIAGVVSRAIVQDGVKLMQSHLEGLSEEEEEKLKNSLVFSCENHNLERCLRCSCLNM